MVKYKSYVEVCFFNDRGDLTPPHNFSLCPRVSYYRPELVIGDLRLLVYSCGDDEESYDFMTKEKANSLAKKIASHLGIEAKLRE